MTENPLFGDALLKRQAREIKEISDKKKSSIFDVPFDVAFKVLEKYNQWKMQYPKAEFKTYLSSLVKQGGLTSKVETLKHDCKVAGVFVDLETPSNRKLAFDSYREIANSKLIKDQKEELKKEAEEYKYSGIKIRKRVKTILGITAREKQAIVAYTRNITFTNNDQFLEDVKTLLENKKPKEGDEFIIKKLRK